MVNKGDPKGGYDLQNTADTLPKLAVPMAAKPRPREPPCRTI